MDLSIEAIALEPGWRGLFTPAELDQAMATLSDYDFSPALEAPTEPGTDVPVPIEREPSFAPIRLSDPRRGFSLGSRVTLAGPHGECEVTAESATALRNGEQPPAHLLVRKHVGECLQCRDQYPDLAAAFNHFDETALQIWSGMLTIFQETMKLEDEHLERLMPLGPEDYEEPAHDQFALERELDFIRPICAWRAVRLGCHIAKFMSAFAWTFMETGDLWLRWRKGEIRGPVSDFVRATDRERFLLALLAANLLLVRSWATEDDGVLWMPADEDLVAVPGVVLDSSQDLDEWEELLGKPPEDLHAGGILYLAYCAAVAQLVEAESGSRELAPGMESEQPGGAEGMFRAIISHLQGMGAYMKSADPHASEESLLAELPGTVYEMLEPEVRSLLLASEQSFRTQGYASPGSIVHKLATAFELQLQHSVMSDLFDHLKCRGLKNLRTPDEWVASGLAERREKPPWRHDTKADRCTLGDMKLILSHPEPAVADFFDRFRLVLTDIQGATESVLARRNDATHGRSVDAGTAAAIRADWLHWRHRAGGIFSVFFRND